MEWSSEADAEARAILRLHAEDLYEEASRVAARAEADTVAPAYVRQAATTIRVRRTSSAVGDVFLALGPALAGLAGGVGTAVLTADAPVQLQSWVTGGSIGVGCVGMLLTGAGAALKVRS